MVLIVKRFISTVSALLLALSLCPAANAEAVPAVSAQSAVVIHAGGETLYEKNADAKLLIASTTKIMTAIVVIENCALDDSVEILPQWCGIEGSSMYLEPGQSYTVRELLTGLLLVSGNDAATALACHTAGSEERFVLMMNKKAAALGMRSSRFSNPHGLNAADHFSTARDMARLMAYCMDNEAFAAISGMKNRAVGAQTLINHNRLLWRCPGCIGGKTGFTEAAGRCLVSCCERDGTRYICVTLNAPDDWNDHGRLYDWAFSRYSDRLVTEGVSFEIPVVSGRHESVRVIPAPLTLFLPTDAELTLEAELPYFVFAPIEAGEEAGTASIFLDGEKIAETKLLFERSVTPAARVGKLSADAMERTENE